MDTLNHDFWNHICFVWSNTAGDYKFYINGTVRVSGILKLAHKIPANGSLVIGGKSFSGNLLENPFNGTISCLQMWNNQLPSEKITSLFDANKCVTLNEPFFNWNEVKNGIAAGNVKWNTPSAITEGITGQEPCGVHFLRYIIRQF